MRGASARRLGWSMAECRYFPECQRCNETGDSWFPCEGGADGTRCEGYEPMPDVDALLALADDLDRMGDGSMYDASISDEYGIARRIREALGVER